MTQNPTRLILYAEDDPDDRDLFQETLSQKHPGYSLLTFGNGRELLHFLEHERRLDDVSLVVTDINMPQGDGIEVLKIIKADPRYRPLPIVLFSTNGSPQDYAIASELQTRIVVKPHSYSDLLLMVDELVRHCR